MGVKYWEIIADNLSKAVGVWAASQPLIPTRERSDCSRSRGKGKRFVVHADEKLNCVVELESAIRVCGEWV
jgi:hypothetical protein